MKFFVQLIPFFLSGLVYYSVFPFFAATAVIEEDVGAPSRELQQQQESDGSGIDGSGSSSTFNSLVDKWAIPIPTVALINNDKDGLDGGLIDDEQPQIISLTYGVTVAPYNDYVNDNNDRIISATLCNGGDDETNSGLTLTLTTRLDEIENQNGKEINYYSVVNIALEDLNLIVNDSPDLYSVISSDGDDDGDGNTNSTTTTTTTTKGSIEVCVRYALSATSTEGKAMEVNYVESIVTILISSTSDDENDIDDDALLLFEIEDVTVATKTLLASFDYDRYIDEASASTSSSSSEQQEGEQQVGATSEQQAVAVQKAYTVEAYLCRGGGDNTRIIRSFSQGGLVTFCVQPDAASRADGIVIKSIESFTWIRQELRIGMGMGAGGGQQQQQIVAMDTTRQEAIKNGAAYDMLTAYDGCGGGGDDAAAAAAAAPTFCSFSSLLKADFYASKGKVTGKGSAILEFSGAAATTTAEAEAE